MEPAQVPRRRPRCHRRGAAGMPREGFRIHRVSPARAAPGALPLPCPDGLNFSFCSAAEPRAKPGARRKRRRLLFPQASSRAWPQACRWTCDPLRTRSRCSGTRGCSFPGNLHAPGAFAMPSEPCGWFCRHRTACSAQSPAQTPTPAIWRPRPTPSEKSSPRWHRRTRRHGALRRLRPGSDGPPIAHSQQPGRLLLCVQGSLARQVLDTAQRWQSRPAPWARLGAMCLMQQLLRHNEVRSAPRARRCGDLVSRKLKLRGRYTRLQELPSPAPYATTIGSFGHPAPARPPVAIQISGAHADPLPIQHGAANNTTRCSRRGSGGQLP